MDFSLHSVPSPKAAPRESEERDTAGITFYICTLTNHKTLFFSITISSQTVCVCYLDLVKQFCVQQRQLIGDLMTAEIMQRARPLKKELIKHTDKPTEMRSVLMTPETGPLPGRDAPRGERFEHVHVSQEPLLFHFIEDVLSQDPRQTQLSITDQPEDQIHQLPQDVLGQLHQTDTQTTPEGSQSHTLPFKRLLLKEINTFTQEGHIKLIKCDS